jgi:hypothetical protein
MDISIVTQSDKNFRILQTNFGERTVLPNEETVKVEDKTDTELLIKNESKLKEDNLIKSKKLGDVYIATDGERSAIGKTKEDAVEGVKEAQETTSNAAPLENSSKGHPFDPFGGTSWEGKGNNFN